MKCTLCDFEYKNNKGGRFTVHLNEIHSMTLEDYIIQHDYHGIVPKCKCGNCDDKASFERGKFKQYAWENCLECHQC